MDPGTSRPERGQRAVLGLVGLMALSACAALAVGEQVSCALTGSPAEVYCWGRDLRDLDAARSWDVARRPAAIVGLPSAGS